MLVPHLKRRAGLIAAAALVFLVLGVARSYRPDDTPYTPHHDDEVLERVPAGSAQSELRRLEASLARQPDDLPTATQVARLHMAAARRSGDARQLSYAEAALAPWWGTPEPPLEALFLKATIEQTRHEFTAALADLDALVKRAPANPQGWLTRALVLGVLGRYAEARQGCAEVAARARTIVAVTCRAAVDAPTAEAAKARDALSQILGAPGLPAADATWARSVRGELSWYLGDVASAEADLRAALAADADDVYSRALLADLLLDTDRARDVLDLVSADEVNEVLLLRRAIAARRTHASGAQELAARLRASIDALRERGDTTHQREEARFLLDVEGDGKAALPVAVANWAVQHEPWDARVLLEAGALDPAQAAPALVWARETKCAWPPLVAALKKVAP